MPYGSTPTGTTDRLRLPAPSRERPTLGNAFVAPATSDEMELVRIWSEVLAIDAIGIHDDFFELGGDSLRAAMVVGRVAKRLDAQLPFTAIYETPTIAQLATLIREGRPGSRDEVPRAPTARVEGGEPLQ
jgi:tyrocidine synthetase-3